MEQESLHIFIENNGHAATPRIEYILKSSSLKYSPLQVNATKLYILKFNFLKYSPLLVNTTKLYILKLSFLKYSPLLVNTTKLYILNLSFLKFSPLSGQYYQAIHFKT